jgi:hypothetical protein
MNIHLQKLVTTWQSESSHLSLLCPRLHHACQARPAKIRVVLLRLEDPMQVSVSVFDIRRQIDFDQDVDGQALAGFLDEWDLELPEDLASGTVAAEEVRGADLVQIT